MGLSVWAEDEAGPYSTQPYPTSDWQPQGEPLRHPHEFIPNGTAKILTLFHPVDGQVYVKGVEACPNRVLHPWLKECLSKILQVLPVQTNSLSREATLALWESWRQGLTVKFTLPEQLPPLRMLLVSDNLAGHKTAEFVLWLCEQGILPLHTPLGGSWLNMAESIQKILKQRALGGQYPRSPQQIIDWVEAVADAWNQNPTPFEWGGKRAQRRWQARLRKRYHLGGSGACTRFPIRRYVTPLGKWRCQ